MKVLFLDIDGVVNSAETFTQHDSMWPLDKYMAFLVGKIVMQTGCKVVLSSSWRNHPDGVQEVEKRIVPVMDKTCRSWYVRETGHHSLRGGEIQKWIDSHPEVTRYCILDDDSDMLPHQKHFKTSWKVGLTDEISKQVIEYLNA